MRKMPPDCTQERVFCERTPSKKSKFSACGGPIIKNHSFNAPKFNFTARWEKNKKKCKVWGGLKRCLKVPPDNNLFMFKCNRGIILQSE